MNKSKQVKIKNDEKSKAWKKSISTRPETHDAPMVVNGEGDVSVNSETETAPGIGSPIALDDSVLVLWDDGSEGVCHYLNRNDLKIIDDSKDFVYGTRISYNFKGRDWTGRIPSSVSELIESCCMETAVVDIRSEPRRQVLVLWDNPSAGACHYMYTKDLRIIDDSRRINRGTRVAMRLKDIHWTGQVPPAIYNPNEKGTFNHKFHSSDLKKFAEIKHLLDGWLPATASEPSPCDDYAVIDGFWNHIDKFCRNITDEDIKYIEKLILGYHNRYRLRNKLLVRRRRDRRLSVDFDARSDEYEVGNKKIKRDVEGDNGDVPHGKVSEQRSQSFDAAKFAELRIDVNETDSSPASCSTLESSALESVPTHDTVLRRDSLDLENSCSDRSMTPSSSESHASGVSTVEDDLHSSEQVNSTAHSLNNVRSNDKENNKFILLQEMKCQYVCKRLRESGIGQFEKAADAIVEKYTDRYPIISSVAEDFITSDESLTIETGSLDGDSSEDEVLVAIRRKRAELMAVESKNSRTLQLILRNMRYSVARQQIEERLSAVDEKVTKLTGELMKVVRLKYRSKPKYKCQILKNRKEAQEALATREQIIQELREFDSKCSHDPLNLYG